MLDFRREEGSPNIISRKTHPLDASDDPAAQKDYALWLTTSQVSRKTIEISFRKRD
jgi:hypothetical protein